LCIQLEVIVNIVAVGSVGFLADALGRRLAMTIFGLWFVASLSAFALIPVGVWWVIPAHVAQSFAATAMYVALRFTTVELFPNDCRATAAAWTDLFMTLTAAASTWLIGRLIDDRGGHGVPLWTVFFTAAMIVLICLPLLRFVRETRGQRLEEVE
jgi:MFS family permease